MHADVAPVKTLIGRCLAPTAGETPTSGCS